jgi:chromosome segregation ATPase
MKNSSSSQSSILNQSNVSLQRAKQQLSGLKSVLNSKPVSPIRNIIPSYNSTNNIKKPNTLKSFSNDIQIGLISELNNEIIINNRNITGNNVKLSNKLNSLLGQSSYSQNNINKKINELNSYCNYLEDQLRENNDSNTAILNSYEELNINVKDTIKINNRYENEITNIDNDNLEVQKVNDELKRNLTEIKKRFENESKILVDYYNQCKKDYNEAIERYSFLKDLNKNLEKSKKDYNEIINKMKETIKILSMKKNSESLDLKEIERRLNTREKEIEKRDNKLKELKDINDKLVKEGTNIQEEINEIFDELSSHNQLGNQLSSIKDTINTYDNKIEQLKSIIRNKDKEIEDIKSNYSELNKKLKKRKILDNEIPDSRNNKFKERENDNFNYYNNTDNINNLYNIESNKKLNNDYETIDLNNNIDNTNNNLNIYDEEIKKIKESNEKIDLNERKNHAQRLLEENKKLQQEYLNLIGQNIDLKNEENNENEFNEDNINEMNKLLNIDSKLNPIEEQKEEKESINENSSPINLPLQMIINSDESGNNYDVNN